MHAGYGEYVGHTRTPNCGVEVGIYGAGFPEEECPGDAVVGGGQTPVEA
jgi:hypothetical protein